MNRPMNRPPFHERFQRPDFHERALRHHDPLDGGDAFEGDTPPPPGGTRRGPGHFGGPGRGGHGPGPFGPGGFGPGGAGPFGGRRRRRGDIRLVVLAALRQAPGHGYELISRIEERTGGRWRPSPGSVYPTLQALQDEGLISAAETDGKRVYSLTDAGKAFLDERLPGDESWPGDDDGNDPHHRLRLAAMGLLAAAKQIGWTADADTLSKAEAILTQARRDLYKLLAEA